MNRTRRFIASLLVVSMTGLGLPPPSHAAIVGTDAALAAAQRDRVATLLHRAEVRAQLESHGVRPADVKARDAALTDEEVAQLAGWLDRLPAGGEGIIGALVIVFLVLLITDLLGLTKVFPFTRPVRWPSGTGFALQHGEPSREPDFPVPPAARREPGRLVSVGP